MSSEYDIFVSKADFKFNCAHFIAHKGFRERLHGHNYQISVKVVGGDVLSDDGYLIDFGDIKKVARSLCKSMNEYFLCPMKSDVMKIDVEETQVCLTCEDGAKFSFPKSDCIQLPIVHSSAEELSHYLWCQIVR
jgi:dihydroneopterin triphosphate aldolase (PTPS-III) / 6-pyruvoyltetrahydropterin synthase